MNIKDVKYIRIFIILAIFGFILSTVFSKGYPVYANASYATDPLTATDDQIVNFPDPVLKSNVEKYYGIDSNTALTVGLLKKTMPDATFLGGKELGISNKVNDYQGIEFLTGAKHIRVAGSQVANFLSYAKDLTYVKTLTIESGDVSLLDSSYPLVNNISELRLSGLTTKKVADIQKLPANITDIFVKDINKNEDISILSNIGRRISFDTDTNYLSGKDLNSLSNVRFRVLKINIKTLDYKDIVDKTPDFESVDALHLTAYSVFISDGSYTIENPPTYEMHNQFVSFLNKFKKAGVKSLNISNTPIKDLSFLKDGFGEVEEITMGSGWYSDVSPLANLKKLKRVVADTNFVADLSVYGKIPDLEYADVSWLANDSSVIMRNRGNNPFFSTNSRVFKNPLRDFQGNAVPILDSSNSINVDMYGNPNPAGGYIKILDIGDKGVVKISFDHKMELTPSMKKFFNSEQGKLKLNGRADNANSTERFVGTLTVDYDIKTELPNEAETSPSNSSMVDNATISVKSPNTGLGGGVVSFDHISYFVVAIFLVAISLCVFAFRKDVV